jgi:hypothetical protein
MQKYNASFCGFHLPAGFPVSAAAVDGHLIMQRLN